MPQAPLKEFANHNITQILKELAEDILMVEPWGNQYRVLQTYINHNFVIAKSQQKVYEDRENGIAFWKVGYLVNRAADPVWFYYEKNPIQGKQFWNYKKYHYGNIPIDIPEKTVDDFQVKYQPPEFFPSWGISIEPKAINHIMINNKDRLVKVFGEKLANNSHMLFRTIIGEVTLQKKKSDVIHQWYNDEYQFLMPLYLTDENTVDLTAPLTPNPLKKSYEISTLLYPEYSYPHARAVVKNRSAFAGWMNLKEEDLNSMDLAEE